jgi:phage terminase small subunit
MNKKHKRFCEEYVIDLDGQKAAVRAGYKKARARITASELLKRPDVKEYVQKLQKKISEKLEITAEKVIQEIGKLAFNNLQDYINKGNTIKDLASIPRDHAASVESIKVIKRKTGTGKNKVEEVTTQMKLHDKGANLERLGRHLGVFEKDNNQKGKVKISVSMKKANGSRG